ncbi:transposase InsO family protein [Paraburkholderia sp. MM5384-R2]|nr:transposase InsO family protein [Paraburkholderia sp. MM5384-R2]
MREDGIRARDKKRYKVTTDSKHKLPVAENPLERNFTPTAPNQVFTSDMTYIWTDEGWLCLAIVMDLCNREVVGWSIKPRMTADIVTDALIMAWPRRQPEILSVWGKLTVAGRSDRRYRRFKPAGVFFQPARSSTTFGSCESTGFVDDCVKSIRRELRHVAFPWR